MVQTLVKQHPFLADWFPLDVFHNTASRLFLVKNIWVYYLVTQQYRHDKANGLAGTPDAVVKQWAALGLCTKHYYNERTGATKGYLEEDQVEYTLDDYIEWNGLSYMSRIVSSAEWSEVTNDRHTMLLVNNLWKLMFSDVVSSLGIIVK